MKKIELLLLFAAMLSLASCMKDGNGTGDDKEVVVDYETVKPFTSLQVEGRNGQIANVIMGDDTIATCYGNTTIAIPNTQYAISRADDDVRIAYSPITPEDEMSITQGIQSSSFYYVVAFEDGTKGDNDYNDLVMHIYQEYKANNAVFGIRMQPVAMGNTKILKFGADIYYCDASMNVISSARMYYSDNVKRDFFGQPDELVMINTYPNGNLTTFRAYSPTPKFTSLDGKDYQWINYHTTGNSILPKTGIADGCNVYLNWFIELVNGERLYAVPSYYKGSENWTNEKGYPQGIVITRIREKSFKINNVDYGGMDWLDYPIESMNIENVYPGFKEWIAGNGMAPDWANPNEGTYIDAVTNYTGSIINSIYTWGNTVQTVDFYK